MTPEQFCYWLQGWFELNKTIDHRQGATPETLKVLEDHLQTVFKKVTPTYPSIQQPADLTRLINRPAPWFDSNNPPNFTC